MWHQDFDVTKDLSHYDEEANLHEDFLLNPVQMSQIVSSADLLDDSNMMRIMATFNQRWVPHSKDELWYMQLHARVWSFMRDLTVNPINNNPVLAYLALKFCTTRRIEYPMAKDCLRFIRESDFSDRVGLYF